MWFQDLANKPLHSQKPTAETFSDTPLPGSLVLEYEFTMTQLNFDDLYI